MVDQRLIFDLLARETISDAMRRASAAAFRASEEMRAAFAKPIDAKIDTRGFDSYRAKLGALALEQGAFTDVLVRHSESLTAEAERMTASLDVAGHKLDALTTKHQGILSKIFGGEGSKLGMIAKLGGLATGGGIAGIGGVTAGAGILGLIGGAVGGTGAASVLGLSVMGQVKSFEALKTQIASAQAAMAGATRGTAAYNRDAKTLVGLQKQMRTQFGPLDQAFGLITNAFHKFLAATRGPDMKLFAAAAKLVAEALRVFAPVANAAARAVTPLLADMSRWLQSGAARQIQQWFATTGVQALKGFLMALGKLGAGFLEVMVKLNPLIRAVSRFMITASPAKLLAVAAAIGAIVAGLWMGNPAIALLGALALGLYEIYERSKIVRDALTGAFDSVRSAIAPLIASLEAFWQQWKGIFEAAAKVVLTVLGFAFATIGDALHVVLGIATTVFDLLSGRWSAAWTAMKGVLATTAEWILHGIQLLAEGILGILGKLPGPMGAPFRAGLSALNSFVTNADATLSKWGDTASATAYAAGRNVGAALGMGLQAGAAAVSRGQLSLAHHGLIPAGSRYRPGGIHLPGLGSLPTFHMPTGIAPTSGSLGSVSSAASAASAHMTALASRVKSLVSTAASALKQVLAAQTQLIQQFVTGFTTSIFAVTAKTSAAVKTITKTWTQGGVKFTTSRQVPVSGHGDLLSAMLHSARTQRGQSRRLNRDVHELIAKGLSPALIEQMASAGESGLSQIAALAGASRSKIAEFNRLNAQATAARTAAGRAAGERIYGAKVAEARKRLHHVQDIEKAIQRALAHGVDLRLTHQGGRLVLRPAG